MQGSATPRRARRPLFGAALGAFALAISLGACSSSDDKSGETAAGAATTATTAASAATTGSIAGTGAATTVTSTPRSSPSMSGPSGGAAAAVEANYAGTDGSVPATGPAAATGKSIWVITCGQAAAGCSTPGNAAVDAAKAIGWQATLCDGELNPAKYGECVTTATAANPSAILLVAVDCQFVQAPLARARAAGIKVFAANAFDCTEQGGQALFDGEVKYHGYGTFKEFLYEGTSKSIADYIIAKTDGKGVTLLVRENDNLSAKATIDGVEAQLKTCAGCTTYTLEITLNDLISGDLANKVSGALSKYSDVTAVVSPYDAAVGLGIGQGVAQSGRELIVTGVEGLAANIELIKSGGQTMAAGVSAGWTGWAAVDGLNRLFAGQTNVDSGIGFQTIDAEHNLPTTTDSYDGNVDSSGAPKQDYKAIYRKSWGK